MPLSPGDRLGPYEILAPLGAGGMGEIYRARDARLEREVAVKVLPERLARDPEAIARFEREARAVAALSHPNILSIHDFGLENGMAYSVTELLEGETLRALLQRAPVPPRNRLSFGLQAAQGLAAAHERNVVHRDVKPDNIFVTKDNRVKILDFGLAKLTRKDNSTGSNAPTDPGTDPGTVLGTVGYMSPEQVRGEVADARSDIFSFGCVLYEIVTGHRAFLRPTAAETMVAVLKEEPPDIDEKVSECPPELRRLIFHCMEKEREARFQSARDLAFALESVSRGPALPLRPRRRARRRKSIDSLAILPFANAAGEASTDYLVDGITEDLINTLAKLSKTRVIARSTVFRYKWLAVDPRAVGDDLDVAAVVTGRLTARGGELDVQVELVDVYDGSQIWGERFRRPAAEILPLEEEIAGAIAAQLQPRHAKPRVMPPAAANSDAYDLYLKGRFHWNRRSEDDYQKALGFFEEAIRIDPGFALAYAGIADAYTFLGGYGHLAPKVAFENSRKAAQQALALGSVADAHCSLAIVLHRYDWDWPASEEEFRLALADNPAHATAHHWYGVLLLMMGRFAEAKREVERARSLDPLSLTVWEDRGYILFCRREYGSAIAEFRKVLDLDPDFANARFDLGIALAQIGEFEAAIAEIERGIALAGERPRPLATLAWALAAAGRKEDALARIANLPAPAFSIALVHVALGDHDSAFAALDSAFAAREDALVSIRVNPRLDPLRKDRRFASLLSRVGL